MEHLRNQIMVQPGANRREINYAFNSVISKVCVRVRLALPFVKWRPFCGSFGYFWVISKKFGGFSQVWIMFRPVHGDSYAIGDLGVALFVVTLSIW